MIGHIAQAYRDGRRDAASGRRRPRDPWRESKNLRVFYTLGWTDERERMRMSGRLPQLELSLVDPERSPSQNGASQMPQDRRSEERMSLSTPEMD